MSTPIQQDDLSPNDPKFYAPPRWRTGEIDAPSIQPFVRASELPKLDACADWTSRHEDVPLAYDFPQSREASDLKSGEHPVRKSYGHPGEHGASGAHMIALATAAVVAWTAFCVTVALERLDKSIFAQLRNGLLSANDSEISVSERLQAANTEFQKASRPVFAPTLAVADASGDVNAALPLSINVTNYTPGTTINLRGLVAGTMLTSGAADESQWRIAIDDLPNTRVIPPADYVGFMAVVAELRSSDDKAIVRIPMRLTWHPVAINSTEAVEPRPSSPPPADDTIAPKQALYEQFLAWQKDSAVTQPPRLKARRHISGTAKANSFKKHGVTKKRRHRIPIVPDLETNVTPWKLRPSLTYNLSDNAGPSRERRSYWNNDFLESMRKTGVE